MKKKTYTIEGDVEFLQDNDSYDDSSWKCTESDGISDIYSYRRSSFVLIRGWFTSTNNCSPATNNPSEEEVKTKQRHK